jgi:hypothetical protein
MLKQVLFALLAVTIVGSSSGCCCWRHNLLMLGRSLHTPFQGGGCNGNCGGNCNGNCGGNCGGAGCVDGACGCGNQGCAGGCGNQGHGNDFGAKARDGGWGCFNFGWGCNNCCSIFGCSSHYLDPQGACYGAYCATGCRAAGCGPMYWGDWFNVPRTTDPCDCCGNFVGPSHNLHGSTPWYYGPPKPVYAYGSALAGSQPVAQPVADEQIINEQIINEQVVDEQAVNESIVEPKAVAAKKTTTAAKIASKPTARPGTRTASRPSNSRR